MEPALEPAKVKTGKIFRYLASYFFIQKSINNFLVVLSCSLFLKFFGVSGLPWVYVLFTILSSIFQISVMKRPEWKGIGFQSKTLKFLLIAMVFLAFQGEDLSGWIIFPFFLIAREYDVESVQAFFDITGEAFSFQESKRNLSVILSVGSCGAIFSGLILNFLMEQLGFALIFLLVGILALVAFFLLKKIEKILKINKSPDAKKEDVEEKEVQIGLNVPELSKKYCYAVLGISMAGSLSYISLEFLFNGNLSIFFKSAEEIASFLGIFGAARDVCATLLQGLLGTWAFTKLRLGSILQIRPAILCIACFIAYLFPCMATVTACQFLMLSITQIFIVPAWVILLDPLPHSSRLFCRRLLLMGDNVSDFSLGLFLLWWQSVGFGLHPVLYLFNCFFLLSTFWGIYQVTKYYPSMIAETLKSLPSGRDLDFVLDGMKFISEEKRIEHLQILANDLNPEIRLQAIVKLSQMNCENSLEIVWKLIQKENDVRLLSKVIKILIEKDEKKSVEILKELVENRPDPRLQADIIETLEQANSDLPEEFFIELLSHPHQRVRSSGIFALIRKSGSKQSIGTALDALKEMILSGKSIDRVSAAVTMGRIGASLFVPALAHLADDTESEVSSQAFQGLSKIASGNAMQAIIDRMERTGHWQMFAKQAWQDALNQERKDMSRLFSSMTDEERRKVSCWFSALNGKIDYELFLKLMKFENSEIREKLFATLADENSEKKLVLSKCLVQKDDKILFDHKVFLFLLKNLSFQNIPTWPDLCPLILGHKNPDYEKFLVEKIEETLWEIAIFSKGKSCFENGHELLAKFSSFLEKKIDSILYLSSLHAENQGEIFLALKKSLSGDSFTSSIAMEFLEESLGRPIARLLAMILKRNQDLGLLVTYVSSTLHRNIESIGNAEIEAFMKGSAC
ncbi:MAG: HEAT repeat domain-containing protein [Candidatus Riflebacteria bacterium]|nr:HEAT repeat domain-containing protein [Candidatus Riflebacteria bacterium]